MRDYENYDEDYDYFEEEKTYENYNGSYAQDVEGLSDQDIDDVFDGDPDAYWNIDYRIGGMTNTKIPGVSFSWRRALGVTKIKRRFTNATGIPTTKSGIERKIGAAVAGVVLKSFK
jgi:hypothetical protein